MIPSSQIADKALRDPVIFHIAAIARETGIETYLVGGYVRDLFLDRSSNDADFITAGNSPEIARKVADTLGGSLILLDEKNQIYRVVISQPEGPKVLDFAPFFQSLETDLLNRDFTLNAMALSLTSGELFDPSGGQKDLAEGRIRHIDESGFVKDPLRLLRAFRFGATLSFSLEPATLKAIGKLKALILQPAGERVREELLKLFASSNSFPYLQQMAETGLLEVILPELTPLKEIPALGYHHLNGWAHTLETFHQLEMMEQGSGPWGELTSDLRNSLDQCGCSNFPNRALLKLAALLHDIGKPACRKVEKDKESYIGHASHGAEQLLPSIAARFRLSIREKQFIALLIREHLRLGFLAGETEPSRRSLYRYCRDLGEETLPALLLSLADRRASLGPLTTRQLLDQTDNVAQLLARTWLDQQNPLAHPKKLLSGKDLIREFGVEPGPHLGILLKDLEEAQAVHSLKTREEAMQWMRHRLKSEPTDKC